MIFWLYGGEHIVSLYEASSVYDLPDVAVDRMLFDLKRSGSVREKGTNTIMGGTTVSADEMCSLYNSQGCTYPSEELSEGGEGA